MNRETKDLILYHGTPNKFTKFDYSYIRSNGTDEGIGFYFTNKLEIANRFSLGGYIMKCKLNVNKPLSATEKTITKEEFKKFLIEFEQEREVLSNYGEIEYYGLNKVLNMAIDCEYETAITDIDLFSGFAATCGSMETTLKVLKRVLGYDHTKVYTTKWDNESIIYLAFDNEDIEILETYYINSSTTDRRK